MWYLLNIKSLIRFTAMSSNKKTEQLLKSSYSINQNYGRDSNFDIRYVEPD
jgi:hypothetical protein